MAEDGKSSGKGGGEGALLSGKRLGAVALLLAASVAASRGLGFVREMVLAARVGVGGGIIAIVSKTTAHVAISIGVEVIFVGVSRAVAVDAVVPDFIGPRTDIAGRVIAVCSPVVAGVVAIAVRIIV